MAGGGSLRVREYASVAEMQRHAAEVRARLFAPRPVAVVAVAPIQPAPTPELEIDEESFVPPKAVTPEDFEEPTAFPMRRLLTLTSHVTGILQREIKCSRRDVPLVKARQIFFWLAKHYTDASFPQMGRHIGGRDHTTALHGVRQVQAVIDRQNIEVLTCPVAMAEVLWATNWKGSAA